jgi:protein-glucosylgalactosylhydroxylysine glucosidase
MTEIKPAAVEASRAVRPESLEKINRKSLVDRHSPALTRLDPRSPLSLGNGEFAFTADITGLQTWPAEYESAMPLCTMAQWGWHTAPLPAGLDPNALRLVEYDTHGRSVGYQTSSEGQTELYKWLRENPHRLHLGSIGLRVSAPDGQEAQPHDICDVDQKLDLWSGLLTSRFRLGGEWVTVRTAVHPRFDLLAVAIDSTLVGTDRLSVKLAFPYGSPEVQAVDWNQSERHRTEVVRQSRSGVLLRRHFETDEYYVGVQWAGGAAFTDSKPHHFQLSSTTGCSWFRFVLEFSKKPITTRLPDAAAVFNASAKHWAEFWTTGSAVEFAGSRDSRAPELERRVVLSQYLTAIQCSGSTPPAETGLTTNSWYGKFHLEMHWWHAAHFALWNRLPLLEKSLAWYQQVLSGARERARTQGYRGARWPKMVGPEGRDSPSPIGPLLIWQQPHPILYADLCYQTHPDRSTLLRYREIVFETAAFMASYAYFESARGRYVLGPPLIPAQENHPPRETWNPTFELAYWTYGLQVAQRWRQSLGLRREPEWDRVIAALSTLPARDGVYLAHENCPQTFTERNSDHPSMLGAMAMLPGDRVDRDVMRRTLKKVIREWRWDTTWGWDYPLTAMTAARLGESSLAIDALLMQTEKNRYLPNGHNWQRPNLPCYLPGNGGLLYAIAMMAGGWRSAPPRGAPGFPTDGSWTVKAENFNRSLLP